MSILTLGGRVTDARTVARTVLAGTPDRLAHTAGVARRAEELACTVDPADRDVLVVAAWLHDVGYSATVATTGFHPLDGADDLLRHGWPRRVCGLVAHHSGAIFVARALGLADLIDHHPNERSPVTDALTYADQTVGPLGQPVSLDERWAEVLARHGDDSVQARVRHLREPYLRSVAARVERRLAYAGARG
jgi:putative nucleotidyltransferase with HDIG domain